MELHTQLQKDCIVLGQFPLCWLLLMNDDHYPWFILVPRREGVREVCDLELSDQHALIDESSQLARAMRSVFAPDKLNIAALGNIVPQLHVHHIARFQSDAAWPKPVWGVHAPTPYADGDRQRVIARMNTELATVAPAFQSTAPRMT